MAIDRSEAKYLLLGEYVLKGSIDDIKYILDEAVRRFTAHELCLVNLRKKGTNPDMYVKFAAQFKNESQIRSCDEVVLALKEELKTTDDALDFLEILLTPPQVTKIANTVMCMNLLTEGKTHKEITNITGLSSSIVSHASYLMGTNLIDKAPIELIKSLTINSSDDNNEFQLTKNALKKYLGKNEKVVIPENVTIIFDNAFENCGFITEIVLPESLTKIGFSAFKNCTNLTKITIPKSVVNIGNLAFDGCTSLSEIVIHSSKTQVGLFAFNNCLNINSEKLFFEDNLSLYCFDDEGVKKLFNAVWDEDLAKNNPQKLKEMRLQLLDAQIEKLEAGVYHISGGEIYHISVPFEQSVANMTPSIEHQSKFADMVTAKELIEKHCMPKWDKNAKVIDYDNFENSNLNSLAYSDVNMRNWLASIIKIFVYKDLCFGGEMWESKWHERGEYSTRFCVGFWCGDTLVEYAIREENEDYDEDNSSIVTTDSVLARKVKTNAGNKDINDEWLFKINEKKNQATITAYIGSDVDVVIPSEIDGNIVVEVGTSAFSPERKDCPLASQKHLSKNLKSVKIPENVKTIGVRAFYKCAELTDITITKNVKRIKEKAFACCSSLNNIVTLDTIEVIEKGAFYGCTSLTSVSFSNKIKEINTDTFKNCTNLLKVVIPACDVRFLWGNVFEGCDNLTIYAPAGSKAEEYAKNNNINFIAE